MSEHSNDPLEERLGRLASEIAWPPASGDLTSRVLHAIAEDGQRPHSVVGRLPVVRQSRWSAIAAALVVAVFAMAILLALVPGIRAGVAERLGLPGVSLAPMIATPSVPVGSELLLGSPITLAEVATTPGYRPLAPPADLPTPDSVWSLNRGGYQQVSYVWQQVYDLPAPDTGQPSLLVSQFQGTLNEGLMGKLLVTGTQVSALEINGQLAYWIEGAPHVLFYEDARGEISEDTLRMAQNVLLWQVDGRIVRLEGALTREQALGIAASMTQPVAR